MQLGSVEIECFRCGHQVDIPINVVRSLDSGDTFIVEIEPVTTATLINTGHPCWLDLEDWDDGDDDGGPDGDGGESLPEPTRESA